MLYFAGTDWFLLSWHLLPLPTSHMVESAQSSYVLCVCVFVFVRQTSTCVGEYKRGGVTKQKRQFKEKECDTELCLSEECVHLCVFAIRQCVKMSRFDCRRFVSHK